MIDSIKLVFAGSVGSGKSTAIKAISEIDVVSTEVRPTDDVLALKNTTTVAMDYGEVSLSDDKVARLYGVPGQKRFDYMWNILARGAVGISFLVDDRDPQSCELLCEYFDAFAEHMQQSTVVIGVTHVEGKGSKPLEKYQQLLRSRNLRYPIFPIDARERKDVLLLIEALAAQLDE